MSLSLSGLADARLRIAQQAFATDDSRDILRFAVEALTSGRGAALVTLVEIRGGAARPLGAQMAVREDGLYCGFVSGGCVEAAAAFEAMEVIACGQDRSVRYGQGSPYFDIVLPCGGGITLAIHKLHSAQPLLAVLNSLEQRRPAGLRYAPPSGTLRALTTLPTTGWDEAGFAVGYRPCVQVIIGGDSLEAQATATLAQAAGYDVHLSDDGTPHPTDADTAVILLWHDLNREVAILQAVRETDPFYIGALGSQRTHLKRVAKLRELGWRQAEIERIKAPIGLFPQARDAQSLALSVLADVAATRLRLRKA
ncbi:MAG: XdhC family protein [Leclercia sp.]